MKAALALLILAAVVITYPWWALGLFGAIVGFAWLSHLARRPNHRRIVVAAPTPPLQPDWWYWRPAALREINRIEIAAGLPPSRLENP